MKVRLLVAAVSVLVAGNIAFAEGLADKKKWKKVDDEMKPLVDAARKACGSKLAVAYDKKSFNASWNETLSISASCGNAVEALTSVCGKDADSKKAGAKLAKLMCKAGQAAAFKVAGAAMNYTMDYASGGMTSAQLEAELEKQL